MIFWLILIATLLITENEQAIFKILVMSRTCEQWLVIFYPDLSIFRKFFNDFCERKK